MCSWGCPGLSIPQTLFPGDFERCLDPTLSSVSTYLEEVKHRGPGAVQLRVAQCSWLPSSQLLTNSTHTTPERCLCQPPMLQDYPGPVCLGSLSCPASTLGLTPLAHDITVFSPARNQRPSVPSSLRGLKLGKG